MSDIITLTPPLSEDEVSKLKSGDQVLLKGFIYTARDAAHKRLVDIIKEGGSLPFDMKGQVIYFVGPTPAKPGAIVGAAGPTTSYRMDAYSPELIAHGLKGMIGKGSRSKEVIDAMRKFKCVYFAATGGAGALISKCIKKAEIIAYEDLGPEAIRRLEVENFQVVVINDVDGNDLYEMGRKKYVQT
ncbi:MAG: Fe-S-containing hydro-lyase [Thermodesulfobacteriota bacterium]|nr:Fe-S-containing hydro-lyase [Thermodesulfobacteriota bacterium]